MFQTVNLFAVDDDLAGRLEGQTGSETIDVRNAVDNIADRNVFAARTDRLQFRRRVPKSILDFHGCKWRIDVNQRYDSLASVDKHSLAEPAIQN